MRVLVLWKLKAKYLSLQLHNVAFAAWEPRCDHIRGGYTANS